MRKKVKKKRKKRKKKQAPPKQKQKIIRCIKRYSEKINFYKWHKLNKLLSSYCKQKDYFLSQYNDAKYICTCAKGFREIRKEWVRKKYTSPYGLQNRGWKLALKDSFETIDRYWAAICYKIRKEIFCSDLAESQKRYLLYAVKNRPLLYKFIYEKLMPPTNLKLSSEQIKASKEYLGKVLEKLVKNKPKVKIYRSFVAEPETYRLFEKNGRQYIALTSLERGKRIIIPLTGKTKIKGMIRVVFDFEKRRLEIHYINKSKTKNKNKTDNVGIDLGITEVFTDSDGDRWQISITVPGKTP